MSARTAGRLAVLTAVVLLAMAPAAIAAGGPPPGKGGGGGEETLGNNLSIPTIFVGGIPTTPAIRSATMAPPEETFGPSGERPPLYGGSYWLQKTEATWRSMYRVAVNDSDVTMTANWSDNLTKHQWPSRQPIRVEMVLYDPDEVMTGFVMTNLTPELDDRVAVFGTDGSTLTTPAAGAEGTVYTRLYVPGARISIVKIDGATP